MTVHGYLVNPFNVFRPPSLTSLLTFSKKHNVQILSWRIFDWIRLFQSPWHAYIIKFTLNSKNSETGEQHIITNKIYYTTAIGTYSRNIFEHPRQFHMYNIYFVQYTYGHGWIEYRYHWKQTADALQIISAALVALMNDVSHRYVRPPSTELGWGASDRSPVRVPEAKARQGGAELWRHCVAPPLQW